MNEPEQRLLSMNTLVVPEPKYRRIYVGQYRCVWGLTRAQWRAVLEAGASGVGYELPPDAELKRRPRGVCFSQPRDAHHPEFDASGLDAPFYQPLDWYPETFQDELKLLDALEKKEQQK